METIPPEQTRREAIPQPQLAEDPGYLFAGDADEGAPASIAESLTVLAEFAGVGLARTR